MTMTDTTSPASTPAGLANDLTGAVWCCTIRRLDGEYLADGLATTDPADRSICVTDLTTPSVLRIALEAQDGREFLFEDAAKPPRRVRLTGSVWLSASRRVRRLVPL